MALALADTATAAAAHRLILNPAEVRQLALCYQDLLDLHRVDVVEDEAFDRAHRLLTEQVYPLRALLRDDDLIVDSQAGLTY